MRLMGLALGWTLASLAADACRALEERARSAYARAVERRWRSELAEFGIENFWMFEGEED